MFRYFNSNEFYGEVEKEISRSSHLIQILVDEFGFIRFNEHILKKINEGVNVEFVVVSSNIKKSINLVNCAKKIIDFEGSVYFVNDSEIFSEKDFFGIFDKSYLISKKNKSLNILNEELFRQKNSLFESLSTKKNSLNLLSGNISATFSSDKTILNKNEDFKLTWNVKNAHEISIDNNIGVVTSNDSLIKSVDTDTKFNLTAKNKDFTLKKTIFIKIYIEDQINIKVKVFDEILQKYIEITPTSNHSNTYAIYKNQKVYLSWDIVTKGKFFEANLGDLNLKDTHKFVLGENKHFIFTYVSLNTKKSKKLSFYGFDNNEKIINNENVVSKNIINKFFKKLSDILFKKS